MSIKRQIAWQAHLGSTKIKEGGKKAAVTCWGDFTSKKLVPIKLSFFLIMGATQCLSPYSTLFARALGLTLKETAIAFAIAPLIPLLAPTLAGLIAEKIQNFKVVLTLTVAVSGVLALLMIAISPARTSTSYRDSISFELRCDGGRPTLDLRKSEGDCTLLNNTVTVTNIKATNCGYLCPKPVIRYSEEHHDKLKGMTVNIKQEGLIDEYVCEIHKTTYNMPQKCYLENYNTSLGYVAHLTNFTMNQVFLDFRPGNKRFRYPNMDLTGRFSMTANEQMAFHCRNGFLSRDAKISILTMGSSISNSPPSRSQRSRKVSKNVPKHSKFKEAPSDRGDYVLCVFTCDTVIPFDSICSERPSSKDGDVYLTLWLFVSMKACLAFSIGLTYTLFEASTIAVLKHYGNDYGLQRLYGSIGGMVFAPMAGLLIDCIGEGGANYRDYYVTLVLYCLVKLVCAVVISFIDLRLKAPSARNLWWQNVCKLLLTLEVFLLICAVLFSGICYGFIENFQPWLLRDLGAPHWLIGLTTTVSSLAALPFLAISGTVCAKFGHVQSICFGLMCYSVRCMGYSLISNPYMCLPFEVVEGATTGMLIAATILYVAKLAPKASQPTLQGVLATVHYGIGKSLGSFAGGYLMSELGSAVAFQVFSGTAATIAFIYYIIYKLYLLPKHQKMESFRRQVCNMPIRTMSMKEHRRNSVIYDRNLIAAQKGENSDDDVLQGVDGQVSVRESTSFKPNDGDNLPPYRYQQVEYGGNMSYDRTTSGDMDQQNAEYPCSWSDEEDESMTPEYRIYPQIESTPNSSTPYKYDSNPPECDLSDVPEEGYTQEAQTMVSHLDETDRK